MGTVHWTLSIQREQARDHFALCRMPLPLFFQILFSWPKFLFSNKIRPLRVPRKLNACLEDRNNFTQARPWLWPQSGNSLLKWLEEFQSEQADVARSLLTQDAGRNRRSFARDRTGGR